MTKSTLLNKVSTKELAVERKILNNNKKTAMSNKGIVNLLNVFYAGGLNDGTKEEENKEEKAKNKLSNMTYVSESPSELTRMYGKIKGLKKEMRYVGDAVTSVPRLIENIQDEIIILTIGIRKKDKFVDCFGRVYVAKNKVFIKLETKYIDIVNNVVYTAEELKDVNVKVYGALVYSPSQEKKGAITCFKLYSGEISGITEEKLTKAEGAHIKILDEATNGMYTELMKMGEVAFKKCVKANARLSQILAPSKVLGICTGYGLILDDEGLTSYDGACHLNFVTVQEMISKYFQGTKILGEAVAGKTIQMRPLGVKGAAVTEQPEFLEEVMNGYINITFIRERITDEIQAKLLMAFDKLDKSEFRPFWVKQFSDGLKEATIVEEKKDNKTIKILKWIPLNVSKELEEEILRSFEGNGKFTVRDAKINDTLVNDVIRVAYAIRIVDEQNQALDFISDLNSFKAPVDFRIAAKMVVLDMSKEKPGKTKLSMQMLSSLLLLGQPGLDYIRKTMLENINDSFDKLMAVDSETPRIEDFMNDKFFLVGTMQTGLKHFVMHHDIPAYKSMIQNWLNGQLSSVRKLNVYVDGMFERLTADWAYLLAGVEIIKYGECFSGAANKYMSKNHNRFITIYRSPKIGFREFYRAKSVTLTEVKKRIDKLVTDKNKAALLKYWYAHIQPGTNVLPAGPEASEKVKDLLGGADFDFDGAASIWDEEYNELKARIVAMVVSVIKPKGGIADKFKIGSFQDAYKMFLMQKFNGNMSIGEWTNMNQLAQLLLFVPFDVAKKLIKREFVANDKLSAYVSPIAKEKEDALKDKGTVRITVDKTDKIVNAIRNCKIETQEELNIIIEDLNIVLRGFQERTIDASKSADVIDALFNLLNNVSLLCLYDYINVDINWEDKTVKASYDDRKTEAQKRKDQNGNTYFYFIINDVFHEIMIDAVKKLETLCDKAVKRVESMGFIPDQIKFMQNMYAKYTKYDGDVIYISKRLTEINRIRIEKVENLKDEKGQISKYNRKVMMPEISKEYNICRDALQDMLRRELVKITNPVEKAAYVKYMAMHSTDDDGVTEVRPDGGSKLCHNLLPEEYFLLAMNLDENVSKVARTRLDKQDKSLNDGDKIVFENGISESGLIVDQSINGEFVYRVIDKVPYIEAEISTLMDKIMPKVDLTAPKTVVVRVLAKNTQGLTSKEKNKKHAKMMAKVDGWKEDEIGLILKPWKKGQTNSYDKASVVIDGEVTTLGKFQAPRGESQLSKLVNNFKGVISCVNSGEFKLEEVDINEFGEEAVKEDSYFINVIVAYEKEIEVNKAKAVDTMAMMQSILGGANTAAATTETVETKPVMNDKLAAILAKFNKKEEPKVEEKKEETENVENEILNTIGQNEYDDLL